ncbi:MAG: filamentous hemagglutinin N-terminal domain-containing protein [Phycisphaerales bacterium]
MTRRPSPTSLSLRGALTLGAVVATSAMAVPVLAGGGIEVANVRRGDVKFERHGNHLTVTASNGAIIDYNRFSIAAGEVAQFVQPTANSRVLNRVTGREMSRIDGALLSNGIVYLVNPQGIRVGGGAFVNVGGFHAAAGAMADQDFINGIDRFTGLTGQVTNEGLIRAESVTLVGQYVANRGTIDVPDGVVAMAAGDSVYLQRGSGPIMVSVTRSQMGEDGSGKGEQAGVSNTGTINVGKGQAAMVSGDFYALGLDLSGTIIGKSIAARGGKDSTVAVNGTLDASDAAGKGGTVDVLGERVGLFGDARIAADGATGGGRVRVGGDYLGGNDAEAPSADRTYVGPGARVTANALVDGSGGRVIVWSDTYTAFLGSIEAKGAGTGAGGFVETSSAGNLQAFGRVETAGVNGWGGCGCWIRAT